MHQLLADEFVLGWGEVDVSQAVAMGDDNMVSVQIDITSASAELTSSGVTFTLQGSNDLENWTTDGIDYYFEATATEASSSTYLPWFEGPAKIGFPFVRLRYENNEGSIAVVIRASINTSKV